MNSARYSRQFVLAEVGATGQGRLAAARVLCVGVGGLGSPASLYLAAAGVGTLGLIDHDRVDCSNLQRQILFQTVDEGRPKATVAVERLAALNPDIKLVAHTEQFTDLNAEKLLADYDLVIEGSDNFATKFLANDAAFKRGIPLIYGAASGLEGQTALFWAERGACFRCLHPAPPRTEIRNCAEAGVLGPVVGAIGSLQANLALQQLISAGDPTHALCPPVGELVIFDLAGRWNFRSFRVPKDPSCPTCSRPPATIELQFSAETCVADSPAISTGELLKLIECDPRAVHLLDVRELNEWHEGHLPGALHWPLGRLELGELPPKAARGTHVIVYCHAGSRSIRAAKLLANASYAEAKSLSGGIAAWSGPIER